MAETLTNYEKAVKWSCELATEHDFHFYNLRTAPYLRILGIISLILTMLTTVFLFCDRRNWNSYPQKYLGLICLAQISCYHMEIYLQYNICEDFEWHLSLIQSTLFCINSATSRFFGITIAHLSRL